MIEKKALLTELKALLVANFGEDINNVILFGSQVTGKARDDSDYDVLVVLNREYDWDYEGKIISVIYDLELAYDIFIDTKIISLYELKHTIRGKQPIFIEAIQEGICA